MDRYARIRVCHRFSSAPSTGQRLVTRNRSRARRGSPDPAASPDRRSPAPRRSLTPPPCSPHDGAEQNVIFSVSTRGPVTRPREPPMLGFSYSFSSLKGVSVTTQKIIVSPIQHTITGDLPVFNVRAKNLG